MYKQLLAYISQIIDKPIADDEKLLIEKKFHYKKLRKKQYFLQEGEVWKHLAFIVKGAMRQYWVDDKEVEHIVHLRIENWWVGDRESWAMNTPTKYNIDAWETTELLLISRADTLTLAHQSPAYSEMMRVLDERNFIATQKRITSSISLTAEKRYADLANHYPEFLQRFPQHAIASYLGISKDTLSRVRKQLLKK